MPYLKIVKRAHECSPPHSIGHRGARGIWVGTVWGCPICKKQWIIKLIPGLTQEECVWREATKDEQVVTKQEDRVSQHKTIPFPLDHCPDCNAQLGQPHESGCDVEICSVCGDQYIAHPCPGHDPLFARWTGFWPGKAEADALGIDLNELYRTGLSKYLFVKPKES